MVDKKTEYNLNPYYNYKGKVNRVVDADTVDATIDVGFGIWVKQRFRIDAFDAPETWRPKSEAEATHGKAATERAKELLLEKQLIFITSKEIGVYGRYGASIILPDGTKYKDVMISEGYEKRKSYENVAG